MVNLESSRPAWAGEFVQGPREVMTAKVMEAKEQGLECHRESLDMFEMDSSRAEWHFRVINLLLVCRAA